MVVLGWRRRLSRVLSSFLIVHHCKTDVARRAFGRVIRAKLFSSSADSRRSRVVSARRTRRNCRILLFLVSGIHRSTPRCPRIS